MGKEENILVSVVVVTFNSMETIVQTLDSIYRQTYKKLEVIVHDDSSQDDTIDVIKQWSNNMKANERFVRFLLCSTKENSGTAINANEGCMKANGDWIKIIAGDDILFDDCIEKNINYIRGLQEDILLMSEVSFFYEADGKRWNRPSNVTVNSKLLGSFNERNPYEQYLCLLRNYRLSSPTFFFSKKVFDSIGGYDIRYGIVEDWPFVVKWTKSGHVIRYMNEITVYYRVGGPESVKAKQYYNQRLQESISRFKKECVYPEISKLDFVYWTDEIVEMIREFIMIKVFNNTLTPVSTFVNYIITWCAPYNWKLKFLTIKDKGIEYLWQNQKWNLRK